MAQTARNRKKFEVPKDNNKLNFQQIVLEKITANLLENLDNNICHRNHNLKHFITGIKNEHEVNRSKCRNEILEIHKCLQSLRKNTFVLDLDQKLMEDFLFNLADKITSLKQTNLKNLESLAEQERSYRAELEALDKRMVELKDINNKSKRLKVTAKHSSVLFPKKQHEEVEVFDKFLLRTGGHTGGWSEEDHILFLRHEAKYKGQALVDNLHEFLPGIPLEVIGDHQAWYKEYSKLKSKQKEGIKAWREAQKKIPVLISEEKKEPQQPLGPVLNTQLAEKKKELVKEWKLRKQENQIIKKQIEEDAKKKAAESLQSRMRKEQERQRQTVLQYKEQKRQEEEAKKAMTKKRDSVADSKLIMMFQERDREYVRRCEEELRAKSARAVIKRRPKVMADRDPERLLRPTAVWQSRVKQREEPEVKDSSASLHLQNLPRLKVPSWRQLIS